MTESLLPIIIAYCTKFETDAYSSEVDHFLHFLFLENTRLREVVAGRDQRIIALLKENGLLRKQIGEKK